MLRIIPDGLEFREHVILKDGQGVLLRPATPEDIPLVEAFMKTVSPESLRMRFMVSMSEVPRSVIEDLCSGDFTDRGCLLAITGEGDEARVVGLGNYVGMGNGRSAEVAFLVADDYQGRGISTALLERLAGLAAAQGYVELEAEVLPENQPMLNVFRSSGFQVHQVWDSGAVHIELPVTGAAALKERAELRERIAVANSLLPLLRPRAVAVVGASRKSTAIGNMVFRHILASGFAGTVYPVNPQAASVNGVKAYASLAELPEPIDLAVVAVPAEGVLEVAEHAIHAGAKGLVVVTAGFAEAGPEGEERQRQLVELVRSHGVRLVGPSCLGLMNTHPEVRLNASLAPELARSGPAGFFSHSAALGLVILDQAAERGIGFSTFVSAGNRADVSGNDLLLYWEEDPATTMAILYLETFGNPRRFVRIARRMTHKKPILCVKSARSRAGRITAEAKSGLRSGGEAEVEALFRQTGIIRAETLEELFDVAVILATQPLPQGNRVAVIANSAGMATLFADACEANGLELAGPQIINLGALTSPARYEDAVRQALEHQEVDAIFVAFACVGDCGPDPVAAAIRRGVQAAERTTGTIKPVLLCLMGAAGTVTLVEETEGQVDGRVFPSFRFPESAPRALGRVARYAAYRALPPSQVAWHEDVDGAAARRMVNEILAGAAGADTVELETEPGTDLLRLFGIRQDPQEADAGRALRIRIHQDRLFGPLILAERPGGPRILRITPLTDRDIEEALDSLELAGDSGLGELLGRLSQMIEELPWLWSLEGWATPGNGPALHRPVSISLRQAGSGPQGPRP